MNSSLSRRILVCICLLASPALAQGPPKVHALVGARIVVGPGEVVESGTVVIRDGVIEAVGADVEPPPDARVHELEELTIYPGLIDAYTVRGWPESDDAAAPQGGHPNGLVRPEREMLLHAGDDGAARKLREAGFTTAVVAPKEGLFRGSSALINLGAGSVSDNLLRARVAQNAALATNSFRGGYPTSLMGATALFRQTLIDSGWYAEARSAWEANPAQPRPAGNTAHVALAAVASGEEPVVLETRDVEDTLRLAALVREFGLDATLVGNGEEYKRLDLVAATGLPHILPVDFPDPPKVGDDDDLSVGLATLRHWNAAPGNPAKLLAAGLTVALTSHDLDDPKKIHTALARAIERGGLTAEQALAGLTTVPAKMLGIADRAGEIAAGRMANLVITEGDLFVDGAKIRAVWIDGERYEIKESKPAEVDPAGSWDYVVTTGDGQQLTGTLTIAGEVGALSGTITAMGGTLELASVEVSGTALEVSFDSTPLGMPGTIDMSLDISGDSASGSGQSPGGPFTITATRAAGSDDPEVTP